jgi:Ca2+:H+ antiporter
MSSSSSDRIHTADDDSPALSSTPTPASPQLHRTVSSSSHWSATDTPQHHYQGTSYYSTRPTSPTSRQTVHPILIRSSSSSRRGARSTSISSSHVTAKGFRDDIALSEEDEGSDDDDDNLERDLRSKGPVPELGVDDAAEENVTDTDDPITVRERQSLINVEHPFGLPIWKPALYKKSRSVTRYADEALHSIPSAQAERHLLPGNLFWAIVFGWWLAITCFIISALLYIVPKGGKRYSYLVFGLGWYLAWPFGKYVEGDLDDVHPKSEDEERPSDEDTRRSTGSSEAPTVRATSPPESRGEQSASHNGVPLSQHSTITPDTYIRQHEQTISWNSAPLPTDRTSLLLSPPIRPVPIKSYGATSLSSSNSSSLAASKDIVTADWLGRGIFWLALICVIAPLILIVCIMCWGLVITIPMAKLNWALIQHLFERPTSIRFCAAPPAVVISSPHIETAASNETGDATPQQLQFSVKHPRLAAGQAAPSSPTSTVLLCTYRAVGWKYYKYTVGGVNILFVNLLPVVIFAIIDGLLILPMVEHRERAGTHVPALLGVIASRGLIFCVSLASVIPLSYFIGMAVASISAQSSIGMGAVINATFGSVIEVILYSIMLTQGKGHLVEGSIVGSLLAGVLLMPGMSMCSGALRRKEQKFNAKSAGVTSMMLIMAIIGTLTPTLFYQTYGNVCHQNYFFIITLTHILRIVPAYLYWVS